MAKHRKTRKEKKLADSRHNFTHNFVSSTPFEVKFEAKKNTHTQAVKKVSGQTAVINNYSYLVKDLSKTALLTAAILTFQVILFFLFKHHAIVISGLSY